MNLRQRTKSVKCAMIAGMGLLYCMGVAFAQEATVIGMGENREGALDDAKRNAVEQIVGTMIDSRSLSDMAVVQMDEIYTQSRGFVKKITVLEEGTTGDVYRVKAKIDVDTNPDAKLMDRLTMLMMLNDPRIAVVILRGGDTMQDGSGGMLQGGHDATAETAINDRLIGMGFSHVVDAAHVIQLQDTPLLTRIYNGQERLHSDGIDRSIEYLVLGKSNLDMYNIALPDRVNGGSQATRLQTARVNLNIKILNYSTGDVIGTYTVSGDGVENNQARAAEMAAAKVGEAAAKKVEEKFKTFAAKSSSKGIQITVHCPDYQKIEQLADELRQISGVQNVYIRSLSGDKAMLELDAAQKPHNVARMLREKTKLGIFVEEITESTILMAVS